MKSNKLTYYFHNNTLKTNDKERYSPINDSGKDVRLGIQEAEDLAKAESKKERLKAPLSIEEKILLRL